MAVSITQQPASPNVAFTRLMYVISGSNTTINEPQYKFVMDITDIDTNTKVARIKTVPNPDNVGVFNAASFILGDLKFDENWKVEGAERNLSASRQFSIAVGEEYSDSVSGSVTLYDGQGSEGEPAVTGSNIIVFKGSIDNAAENSYDFSLVPFDTGSFTQTNGGSTSASFDDLRGPRLSNCPDGLNSDELEIQPKPLASTDYETITVFGGEMPSGYTIVSGSFELSSLGAGKLASGSIFTQSQAIPALKTIGIGPQNLYNQGITEFQTEKWDLNKITLTYASGSSLLSSSYWYVNEISPSFTSANGIPGIPSQGVWTTTAGVTDGLIRVQGNGSQNTAWSAGGFLLSDTSKPTFQLYNGNTWSQGTPMNSSRQEVNNVGTQTAAIVSSNNNPEQYNGSTWSYTPLLNILRSEEAGFVGSSTSAIIAGGNLGTPSNGQLEEWNNITWTLGAVPLQGFRFNSSGGSSINDAIINMGGSLTGSIVPLYNASQKYNGITFEYMLNNLTATDERGGGANTSNSAIVFGGGVEIPGGALGTTEIWNGLLWYNVASMSTPRIALSGCGNPKAATAWGGFNANGGLNSITSTEEYNGSGVTPSDINNIVYSIDLGCEEYKRFAFINQYGVWDYMSVRLPLQKDTDLKREDVYLPNANYSNTISPYNIAKRGNTTYFTKPKSKFEISTVWLDDDEAQWMTEMLESPSVYIQEDDGNFRSIIVTNSSYQHKTNPKSQKVFQYTLQYEFANQDRARL